MSEETKYNEGTLGVIETDGTATDAERRAYRGKHLMHFTKNSSFEEIKAATQVYMQGLVARPLPEPSHLKAPPLRPLTPAEDKILKEFFGSSFRCSDPSENGVILLIDKNEPRNIGSFIVYHQEVIELLKQRKRAKQLQS